jgi:UDP-glucuronate decarboxylase
MGNFEKILKDDFDFILKADLPWADFKNKKILITGANGFIASYLIRFLDVANTRLNLNISITGTVRNIDNAKKQFKDLDDKFLDLKVINILEPIKINGHYDFIIHMASIATPKLFESNPIGVVLPNTLGTINLLDFASTQNIDRFVFFSTTGVNGFVEDNLRPISEDIYGGLDPNKIENCYLESKRMGENLCIAWHHQKKVPIQIVRPAITYGPSVQLDDGRAYADFIKNIVNSENIMLHSKGDAIRNFCYVADFLTGLFYTIFHGNIGDTYNISSEKEYSILKLSEILTKDVFSEKSLSIEYDFKNNNFLRVNYIRTTVSTKKLRLLGWEEKFSIQEGMKRTVDSYL